MRKKPTNPQLKHFKHEVYIEPTTVAHHKFVLRCADCEGANIYNGLNKQKQSI